MKKHIKIFSVLIFLILIIGIFGFNKIKSFAQFGVTSYTREWVYEEAKNYPVNATNTSVLIGGQTTSSAEFIFNVWNGEFCLNGDCKSSWPAAGTGGGSNWQSLFTNALTPTSTTAGIFVKASSTFDSTLRVNGDLTVGGGVIKSGTSDITLKLSSGDAVFRGVRATTAWSDAVDTQWFQIGKASDNVAFTTYNGGAANRMAFITSALHIVTTYNKAAPVGLFDISNGDTKLFNVLTGGNVGIANTNPQYKLDVSGSLNLNSTSTAYMQGHAVIGSDALQDGYGFTVATTTYFANNIYVNSNATTTGNSLIGNTLYVKDSNVGIGTANPNSKLEIYNSAGAGTITMSGNGSDAYNFDSITMYDTGGKYWAIHHRNTDGGLNNLLFEHYNGSTYNGYMTINPDGHILAPNLRAASLNATSSLFGIFSSASGTTTETMSMQRASTTALNICSNFTVNSAGRATSSAFVIGSDGAAGSKKGCLAIMSSSATWTYIYYNGTTQVISASSCADTGGNSTTTMIVGQ